MDLSIFVLCTLYLLMFLLFNITIKINPKSLLFSYTKSLILCLGVIPAFIGMLLGLYLYVLGHEDGLLILVAATMLEYISSSLLMVKALSKNKKIE